MIDDLLGVPYVELNCYQLVRECQKRRGIVIPDLYANAPTNYGYDEDFIDFDSFMKSFSNWFKVEDRQFGDVVIFSRHRRVPDHIGMMVNDVQFIHSLEKSGVVLSRVTSEPWNDFLIGAYRYRTN
jgi:cell wall-associated NlpC family hydrolase